MATFGDYVAQTGRLFNLPEFGISERLGETELNPTPIQQQQRQEPSSQFASLLNDFGQVQGTATTGQVTTPSAYTEARDEFNQLMPPVQETGPAPTTAELEDYDYSDLFNPVIQSYNQLEDALRGGAEAAQQSLQNEYQQNLGQIGEEETRGLEAQQQQLEREQGREKSQMAEQRRQFSEIQKGIQSLYGGTTGTGAFATEIAGSQAMRNMAQVRNAFTQTYGQIEQAKKEIKRRAASAKDYAQRWLSEQKQNLKSELTTRLAEIGMRRGELEQNRASMRREALANYVDHQRQIERENDKFLQSIYLKQLDASQQLEAIKERAAYNVWTAQQKAQMTPASNKVYQLNNQGQLVEVGEVPKGSKIYQEREDNDFWGGLLGTREEPIPEANNTNLNTQGMPDFRINQ